MIRSKNFLLFYLTSSVGIVLCQGKIYPEYEQYYEGMDDKQRQAFGYFVQSYRRYNKTLSHIPKDKLAIMDEYLDTSGRGTMIDNVLYDNLKEKYDRDKAMQKYSDPDDQEIYMALRKHTPTLASSEISNWVHNINSRYRNILGINETSAPSVATQKSTTIVGKSTKFSTRFTIFKKGEDPFASSEEYEDSHAIMPTKTYPKRKIEPFYGGVEKCFILSTSRPGQLQNVSKEEVNTCNPVEAMVKEYFKSQSIKYQTDNNAIGFHTCPTGSPLSQEKLIKEFEEMAKIPDFRIEQIFQNYENRSAYNSSYIEEYIRANNLSTIWVSDLPLFQNATRATENKMNITGSDLRVELTHRTTGKVSMGLSCETTTNAVSNEKPAYQENLEKIKKSQNEDILRDNTEDDEEEQRKLEDSFKSFLMGQSRKKNESLKNLVDKIYFDEPHLEPDPSVTTEDPTFNSSYYKYIEQKFHEFENKVTLLDQKLLPEQEETTDYEFTYNQERMFHKEVFQNTEELLSPCVIDRLDPSLEKKFTDDFKVNDKRVNEIETPSFQIFRDIQDERQSTLETFKQNMETKTSQKTPKQEIKSQRTPKISTRETTRICPHKKIEKETDLQGTSKSSKQEILHNKQLGASIIESKQYVSDILKEKQEPVVPPGRCETCSNHTSHQQRHRRRYPKRHRSYNRKYFHRYRRPHYPPNPYAYNPYHPPPPYPYPPQYYPPPQPPNFYHFTSDINHEDQSESKTTRRTDNQFDLYMKLKDIFQPVDKLLKSISPQPDVSLRNPIPAQTSRVNSIKIQKDHEKQFHWSPPPPPVNQRFKHNRIRGENYPPKDIYEEQRRFYENTQRSASDDYPDYPDYPTTRTSSQYNGPPTSPRMYRSYQRRHRRRHRQCRCHHHHAKPRRYKRRHSRRKYDAGGNVEKRQNENKDVAPENRRQVVTVYK